MIRVLVLYEQEPDPDRYQEHAALCEKVPGGTFRHGRIFGSPMGHEPPYRYYAEWEFPDRAAFDEGTRSDEFMATGKDAREMGLPVTVMFGDLA